MLHVGLDLSRRRLDYLALTEAGVRAEVGATPPDADDLRGLARRADHGEPVSAAIESMTGARFIHDTHMGGSTTEPPRGVAVANRLAALGPVALMAVGSIALWTVVPLMWIWFAAEAGGSYFVSYLVALAGARSP